MKSKASISEYAQLCIELANRLFATNEETQ